jgi:RNAse (barnase) inhibitor barstar
LGIDNLSEKETVDQVKDKQGIFSKIQNFFTLGYGTKEDLRELDSKLRDLYYIELRDMRHVWEDLYLEVMDAGEAKSRNYKKVIQVLDRVTEKVRHADYGYAGLWDRKGHIRENELARVFNFDRDLGKDLDNLKDAINKSQNEVEAENWEEVSNAVKNVKKILLDFEDKLSEREKHFRPLDIKDE